MFSLNKNFWRFFIFSFYILCQFFFVSAKAEPNEVGDKLFIVDPKAEPIYISTSGTRYWHCDGMISPKLIEIIHSELSDISKEEKIPLPMTLPCHYQRGSVKLGGNSIPFYSVNMYISKESMMSCIQNDVCDNFRTMNFIFKNEKLHRQYMVTNLAKQVFRFSCIGMQGNVVNDKNGC